MKINDILTIHDRLNPKFWSGMHGERLSPEVSDNLKAVVQDFFSDLKLEGADLEDITLTGSLANYNYTKFSDIDLHLLVDFSKIDENTELVREYFNAKTSNWNKKHNITVFGYEIELYVQDINEDHHSTGIYSLMNEKWIAQPNRVEPKIDEKMIKRKANSFVDMIERAEDIYDEKKYLDAHNFAKKLVKKIKKFRQSGLEDKGEYSYENLTFKYLRNKEHMKLLFDLRDKSYDKNMSLEGEFDKKFKIFINMGEIEEKTGFHRLDEIEKFQKRVKSRHKRHKRHLLGLGKQKAGSSFPKKPNYKRGKSSPPGFGGS
jgi:hypothetical protein